MGNLFLTGLPETRITSLNFNHDEGIVAVSVKGHPTQALSRAISVAQSILCDKRWRVDQLTYVPPGWSDLASNGILILTASTEPPAHPADRFVLEHP